jgi:hypothetical protein
VGALTGIIKRIKPMITVRVEVKLNAIQLIALGQLAVVVIRLLF